MICLTSKDTILTALLLEGVAGTTKRSLKTSHFKASCGLPQCGRHGILVRHAVRLGLRKVYFVFLINSSGVFASFSNISSIFLSRLVFDELNMLKSPLSSVTLRNWSAMTGQLSLSA